MEQLPGKLLDPPVTWLWVKRRWKTNRWARPRRNSKPGISARAGRAPQRGRSRTLEGSVGDWCLQVSYSLSIPASAPSEIPLAVAGGSGSTSRQHRQQQVRGQDAFPLLLLQPGELYPVQHLKIFLFLGALCCSRGEIRSQFRACWSLRAAVLGLGCASIKKIPFFWGDTLSVALSCASPPDLFLGSSAPSVP